MSKSRSWLKVAGVAVGIVVAVAACGGVMGHAMMMRAMPAPADSEFGYGPRASASGAYRATLEGTQPYRTGKIFTTEFRLTDAQDQPVSGASITVDGGMPQHGHGLPTAPRVTHEWGDGRYQVDGLKFNMGGWWELKLRIQQAGVSDSITFNIKL